MTMTKSQNFINQLQTWALTVDAIVKEQPELRDLMFESNATGAEPHKTPSENPSQNSFMSFNKSAKSPKSASIGLLRNLNKKKERRLNEN